MIDLLQGAQDALFAALKPVELMPDLPTGLGVYQHLPEQTQPPFIVIGMMTSENESVPCEQLEQITAEVHGVYRGEDRAPLLAMLHAVRAVLEYQTITAPGITFESVNFVRTDVGEALADGVTYVGLSTYKFYAQPA